MPNIFQRLNTGIQRGAMAFAGAPDMDTVHRRLDAIAQQVNNQAEVVKAYVRPEHKTHLDVHRTSIDIGYTTYFQFIRDFANREEGAPEYGSIDRDVYLDEIWKTEPILAGAVYSMSAKMTALKWKVTGRKTLAARSAGIFADAAYMGGYGWGGFSASSTVDFYVLDRGVFWETPRDGDNLTGRLADLGHIDALACTLTGNSKYPIHYLSELTGQQIRFRPGEATHFASLPSPRERWLGQGFCAVSRALRAAALLIGLHKYDAEKLSNLPPEGLAAISGLTMNEFQDALRMWKASRERDNSLTFPQVLWLLGSQPTAPVDVKLVGFSQMPESFDRNTVVTQYVNILALCFGVDAREFWPISTSTLGTAAESEIQHMKAKGKGPGEYITLTERIINNELPEGVEFAYDTQDIEEDKVAAEVAKGWIDAYFPLTAAGGAADEVLTKDEFMRLLADRGVVPDWLLSDDRIVVEDHEAHHKEHYSDDTAICIEWDGRILKQVRMPPYVLNVTDDVPQLMSYKGGPGSGHHNHAGRPGKHGGSLPGKERGVAIIASKNPFIGVPASAAPPGTKRTELNDIQQQSGATVRGNVISVDDPRIGDAVYHMTTDLQAVQDSGVLLARGAGGLGGDKYDQIVSMTISEDIANQLAHDTKMVAGLARKHVSTQPPYGEDRESWGRQVVSDLQNAAQEQGWEWEGAIDDFQYRDYSIKDWLTQYFMARSHRTNMQNPLFFSTAEELASIDPSRVGVIKIPSVNLRTGALLTELDLDSVYASLQEIRLYGDVPLHGADYISKEGEPQRSIRGKPIPKNEVTRGARVTRNTVRQEIQLWRNDPRLAAFAPEEEEEDEIE